MESVVGNHMQRSTEDSVGSSLSQDTALDTITNKQTVQLPTIRYPTGVAAPVLVDRQRNTYMSGVSGVEYTFTQLQVAQTTFRYPPTPPVDIGDGQDRLLQTQQPCEAPALSHMSYSAGETPEKNNFHSLPTPPDLVPISEMPPSTHCNISPQNCTQEANHMYYRKQHWSADDVSQSPAGCLPHPQQPVPWGTTDPMGGGSLLHGQYPSMTMQQGIKSQMLFSLPPAPHSYGEGMNVMGVDSGRQRYYARMTI